jgi:hypothetical protein
MFMFLGAIKNMLKYLLALLLCFFNVCFAGMTFDADADSSDFSVGVIPRSALDYSGVDPVPLVSLVFDDGYRADCESLYSVTYANLETLVARGLVSSDTFDVMPLCVPVRWGTVVAEDDDYITPDMMKKYVASGWELMGHDNILTPEGASVFFNNTYYVRGGWNTLYSWNGWGNSTSAVLDSFEAEFLVALDSLGKYVGDRIHSWAYPLSKSSPTYQYFISKHFRQGILPGSRVSSNNRPANPTTKIMQPTIKPSAATAETERLITYGGKMQSGIKGFSVLPRWSWENDASSKEELQHIINAAIDMNAWVVLYGHDPMTDHNSVDYMEDYWDGGGDSGAWNFGFKGFMYWLDSLRAEGLIDVVTVNEGADRVLRSPIKPGAEWLRILDWPNSDSSAAPQIGAGATSEGYIPNGFWHWTQVGGDDDSYEAIWAYGEDNDCPRVLADSGWGGFDEMLLADSMAGTTGQSRIVKILPTDHWANFSFYARIDTSVQGFVSYESLNVYINQYSLPYHANYGNDIDSLLQQTDNVLQVGSFLRTDSSDDDTVSCMTYATAPSSGFWSKNTFHTMNATSNEKSNYYRVFDLWFYVFPQQDYTTIRFRFNNNGAGDKIGWSGNKSEYRISCMRLVTYPSRNYSRWR